MDFKQRTTRAELFREHAPPLQLLKGRVLFRWLDAVCIYHTNAEGVASRGAMGYGFVFREALAHEEAVSVFVALSMDARLPSNQVLRFDVAMVDHVRLWHQRNPMPGGIGVVFSFLTRRADSFRSLSTTSFDQIRREHSELLDALSSDSARLPKSKLISAQEVRDDAFSAHSIEWDIRALFGSERNPLQGPIDDARVASFLQSRSASAYLRSLLLDPIPRLNQDVKFPPYQNHSKSTFLAYACSVLQPLRSKHHEDALFKLWSSPDRRTSVARDQRFYAENRASLQITLPAFRSLGAGEFSADEPYRVNCFGAAASDHPLHRCFRFWSSLENYAGGKSDLLLTEPDSARSKIIRQSVGDLSMSALYRYRSLALLLANGDVLVCAVDRRRFSRVLYQHPSKGEIRGALFDASFHSLGYRFSLRYRLFVAESVSPTNYDREQFVLFGELEADLLARYASADGRWRSSAVKQETDPYPRLTVRAILVAGTRDALAASTFFADQDVAGDRRAGPVSFRAVFASVAALDFLGSSTPVSSQVASAYGRLSDWVAVSDKRLREVALQSAKAVPDSMVSRARQYLELLDIVQPKKEESWFGAFTVAVAQAGQRMLSRVSGKTPTGNPELELLVDQLKDNVRESVDALGDPYNRALFVRSFDDLVARFQGRAEASGGVSQASVAMLLIATLCSRVLSCAVLAHRPSDRDEQPNAIPLFCCWWKDENQTTKVAFRRWIYNLNLALALGYSIVPVLLSRSAEHSVELLAYQIAYVDRLIVELGSATKPGAAPIKREPAEVKREPVGPSIRWTSADALRRRRASMAHKSVAERSEHIRSRLLEIHSAPWNAEHRPPQQYSVPVRRSRPDAPSARVDPGRHVYGDRPRSAKRDLRQRILELKRRTRERFQQIQRLDKSTQRELFERAPGWQSPGASAQSIATISSGFDDVMSMLSSGDQLAPPIADSIELQAPAEGEEIQREEEGGGAPRTIEANVDRYAAQVAAQYRLDNFQPIGYANMLATQSILRAVPTASSNPARLSRNQFLQPILKAYANSEQVRARFDGYTKYFSALESALSTLFYFHSINYGAHIHGDRAPVDAKDSVGQAESFCFENALRSSVVLRTTPKQLGGQKVRFHLISHWASTEDLPAAYHPNNAYGLRMEVANDLYSDVMQLPDYATLFAEILFSDDVDARSLLFLHKDVTAAPNKLKKDEDRMVLDTRGKIKAVAGEPGRTLAVVLRGLALPSDEGEGSEQYFVIETAASMTRVSTYTDEDYVQQLEDALRAIPGFEADPSSYTVCYYRKTEGNQALSLLCPKPITPLVDTPDDAVSRLLYADLTGYQAANRLKGWFLPPEVFRLGSSKRTRDAGDAIARAINDGRLQGAAPFATLKQVADEIAEALSQQFSIEPAPSEFPELAGSREKGERDSPILVLFDYRYRSQSEADYGYYPNFLRSRVKWHRYPSIEFDRMGFVVLDLSDQHEKNLFSEAREERLRAIRRSYNATPTKFLLRPKASYPSLEVKPTPEPAQEPAPAEPKDKGKGKAKARAREKGKGRAGSTRPNRPRKRPVAQPTERRPAVSASQRLKKPRPASAPLPMADRWRDYTAKRRFEAMLERARSGAERVARLDAKPGALSSAVRARAACENPLTEEYALAAFPDLDAFSFCFNLFLDRCGTLRFLPALEMTESETRSFVSDDRLREMFARYESAYAEKSFVDADLSSPGALSNAIAELLYPSEIRGDDEDRSGQLPERLFVANRATQVYYAMLKIQSDRYLLAYSGLDVAHSMLAFNRQKLPDVLGVAMSLPEGGSAPKSVLAFRDFPSVHPHALGTYHSSEALSTLDDILRRFYAPTFVCYRRGWLLHALEQACLNPRLTGQDAVQIGFTRAQLLQMAVAKYPVPKSEMARRHGRAWLGEATLQRIAKDGDNFVFKKQLQMSSNGDGRLTLRIRTQAHSGEWNVMAERALSLSEDHPALAYLEMADDAKQHWVRFKKAAPPAVETDTVLAERIVT